MSSEHKTEAKPPALGEGGEGGVRGERASLGERSNYGERSDRPNLGDRPNRGERWIWIVWGVVALISVAILPFAGRLQEVAHAVAAFCGFTI